MSKDLISQTDSIWMNTAIQKDDFNVEILTRFPKHKDENMRKEWLPLSNLYNSNNKTEVEYLVEVPLSILTSEQNCNREFKIRITSDTNLDTKQKFCVFLIINNEISEKIVLYPNQKELIIENFERSNSSHKMIFDQLKVSTNIEKDKIKKEDELKSLDLKIKIEKWVFEKIIPYSPTINNVEKKEENFEVTDKQSKYYGVKLALEKQALEKKKIDYKLSELHKNGIKQIWNFKICNTVNMINYCRDLELNYFVFKKNDYETDFIPSNEVIALDEDERPSKKVKKNFTVWNIKKVSDFIKNANPIFKEKGYHLLFEENEIDGQALEIINENNLKDMGISILGHRLKILAEINNLK